MRKHWKLKKYLPLALLIAALLAGYLLFWYRDIGDTLDNSVMLVECLKDGRLADFYQYSALNAAETTEYSANYNIIVYFVFALWNLPTALMHISSGFDYSSNIWALLWCKLFVVFVYALIIAELKKLIRLFNPEDPDAPNLGAYLFASSLCVFVPAMIAVQYDCISILFMLVGLRFYAQRKDLPFIVTFALSVPFKLFSLFVFVPLLLLRYKNVFKLLLLMLPAALMAVLPELPFRGDPYFIAAMSSQNGDAIRLILDAVVSVGGISIAVNPFLIAYFLLLIVCYTRKAQSALDEARLGVYFSFAAFAAFCSLTPFRSYWIVLYTPFLAMLVAMKKGDKTIGILTDTIAGAAGGLFILSNHWIYNTGRILSGLVLKNMRLPEGMCAKYAEITGFYSMPEGIHAEFGHLAGFMDSFGFANLRFAFTALFIAAAIFALWKLYPLTEEKETRLRGKNALLLIRPALLLAVTALLVYVNFAAKPEVKLTTGAGSIAPGSADIVRGETADTRLLFSEDALLTEFSMPVLATGVDRTSRSLVRFALKETETGKVLWEGATGIAALIDKGSISLKMDRVPVSSGTAYTLTVTGAPSERFPKGELYSYYNESGALVFSFR